MSQPGERASFGEFGSLTSRRARAETRAGVGVEVEAFYERYPYPPPVDDLEAYRLRWQERQRRRAEYHLLWPARPYREDFSILVAGCGTSQAARYAVRWPGAHVVGADISAISVEHTTRLKHRHRLGNLEIHRLPVERLAELGASFDQVVCTGVLHHLQDPDEGLRVLRRVLKPSGAMHLMVYAPYGRRGIYMLQEFCRRVGFSAAEGDLHDLLLALKALPSHHPLVPLLQEAPDFRSEAGVADALLHPRDRAYSVGQFLEFLGSNGLAFGRWIRQAPYSLDCGLMSRIPRALRRPDIPIEDQYAAAELFRGNMTRHSAVVYRDDDASLVRIRFDGDAWRDYIPIRMPDTLAVKEQLPSGIATILVNRSHSQTDICLPLRCDELRLFEAVDGERRIGEMLESQAEYGKARSLFERLWLHDQVVFDAAALDATRVTAERSS